MKITVLGSGSSAGTPVIGCECSICVANHPLNRRTRASCHVEVDGVSLVIDTGPDFRFQALRAGLVRVDAVLYTHPHADHLNGIDDLRAFCFRQRAAIPVFGNRFTIENIQSRFDYALLPPTASWERPVLSATVVASAFDVEGVEITPVPVFHGKWPIHAYRIGNMAWLTDLSALPDESMALLAGLDILFLDCLRFIPHHTHLNLDQALALAAQIGAKRTILIHMTHEVDVLAHASLLPAGVEFATDGMEIHL